MDALMFMFHNLKHQYYLFETASESQPEMSKLYNVDIISTKQFSLPASLWKHEDTKYVQGKKITFSLRKLFPAINFNSDILSEVWQWLFAVYKINLALPPLDE